MKQIDWITKYELLAIKYFLYFYYVDNLNYITFFLFLLIMKISFLRKKSSFLNGPATKAFSPPPLLSGHRDFFPYIKKKKFP